VLTRKKRKREKPPPAKNLPREKRHHKEAENMLKVEI